MGRVALALSLASALLTAPTWVAAAAAPAQPAYQWQSVAQTSAIDGKKTWIAGLQSANTVPDSLDEQKPAYLAIGCQRGLLVVFVRWPSFVGSDTTPVRWRLDGGPVMSETWAIRGQGDAVGVDDAERIGPLMDKLRAGHTFVVEVTPYQHATAEVTFQLADVSRIVDQVRNACA